MIRSSLIAVIGVAAFGAALCAPPLAAAQAPEGYRLDVRTPGSMYSYSTLPSTAFGPGSQTWHATLDGRRISEVEFFRAVGRDDLARRAGARQTRAAMLTVGGGAAMLVGSVLMASSTPETNQCSGSSCPTRHVDGTKLGVGLVMFGGGAVAAAVSIPLYSRTVRAREAAEAVRLHYEGR